MKARVLFGLFLLVAVGAVGCDSSPVTPTEDPVPVLLTRFSGFPQPLTEYSGYRESARTIVRDAATWRAIWETVWRTRSPQPALPQVDFTREVVVFVALGERPTGGHGIVIDSATELASGITVHLRTISPALDCGVTQALTQVVDAARMPRRDAAVVFAERATITQCR